MTEPYRKNTGLLRSLLAPLVAEWGYVKVRKTLDDFFPNESKDLGSEHFEKKSTSHSASYRNIGRYIRQIEGNANLPPDKQSVLRKIASDFDEKKFLPTISDIRHFLEMRGQRDLGLKQRSDAFNSLLRVLETMSTDSLAKLAENDAYAGPAKLGPLSDAIREAGSARRQDEALDSEIDNEESTRNSNKKA